MVLHGVAPFYECSSRGDKRFSAFYAVVNGRTIEEQYQSAKVFKYGFKYPNWRDAKGKKPLNVAVVKTLYTCLWAQYIFENPQLIQVLLSQTGLADSFGNPNGIVCQATELWEIRKYYLNR